MSSEWQYRIYGWEGLTAGLNDTEKTVTAVDLTKNRSYIILYYLDSSMK